MSIGNRETMRRCRAVLAFLAKRLTTSPQSAMIRPSVGASTRLPPPVANACDRPPQAYDATAGDLRLSNAAEANCNRERPRSGRIFTWLGWPSRLTRRPLRRFRVIRRLLLLSYTKHLYIGFQSLITFTVLMLLPLAIESCR